MFNIVIITYIPELKLDLFAVKDTVCTETRNNYSTMNTLRQI